MQELITSKVGIYVNLLISELSRFNPGDLGLTVKSAIHLIKFDTVLHQFDRAKRAIPYYLKLREHGNKLLMIRGVLLGYRQFLFPGSTQILV